jgi:hypothetical protein
MNKRMGECQEMRGQMDAGNTSVKRPAGVPSGKFFEILERQLFVGEAPRFNRGNNVLCSCGGQPTKRIKPFYKVAPPRRRPTRSCWRTTSLRRVLRKTVAETVQRASLFIRSIHT